MFLRELALSLVVSLLGLVSVAGFTSALRSDGIAVVQPGSDGGGGTAFESADVGSDVDAAAASSRDGRGQDPTVGGDTPGAGSARAGGRGAGAGGGGAGGSGRGGSGGSSDGALPPIKVAYLVSDLAGTAAVAGSSTIQNESDEANRQDREFRALVDDVNRSGGIAGRRIEARGFTFTISELGNEPRLLERCIEITEDYGAAYVLDTIMMFAPSVQQCFAQHRVVLVAVASGVNEATLAQMVPYVATTYPTIERQFTVLVPKLEEVGYLRGATVGVYLDDEPNLDAPYERLLKPALVRAGTPPVPARARPGDSAGLANAILKFQQADVDHVIFVGTTSSFLAFSSAAEAQAFRPRYAFTDYQAVMGAAALLGNPLQLADAVGVTGCCVVDPGSRPPNDTSSPYNRDEVTQGVRRCLDALSRARGTDYYKPSESGTSTLWPTVCDHFLLWLDTMRAAGRDVEPARFGVALRSLGRYVSPVAYAADFSDGRQSGATHFAAGVFKQSCACFERRTAWTLVG